MMRIHDPRAQAYLCVRALGILLLAFGFVVEAGASDVQTEQCSQQVTQRLLQCLESCESKSDASGRMCKKHCLDRQRVARDACVRRDKVKVDWNFIME